MRAPRVMSVTGMGLGENLRDPGRTIDDAVTETFLKAYVAYKAETNFVDVVPQAERLRLTLNMPFEVLHDERGVASDVTGKGKWGNGDVQIDLDGRADFTYVMGLVRQAFEHQVGE